MVFIKICAVALISVILISLIRIYRPELAMYGVLCGSMLILFYVIGTAVESISYLQSIYMQLSAGTAYFPVILKTLGIAYLTDFTSALCQDAGEKSVASKVELAGKLAVFFAALPVFSSLLELLNELVI